MKRNKLVPVGLVLLLCAPLAAENRDNGSKPDSAEAIGGRNTELGGRLGLGGFLTAHGAFTALGVEGCVRCQGRLGVFLEYNHWWLTPAGGETSVLNLAAGGLRMQGRNKYLRPFFDIGIAVGNYDGKPHDFVRRTENIDIMGAMLGVGMTVSLPKGFYIRPQARLAISPETGVGFASAGLGYRF